MVGYFKADSDPKGDTISAKVRGGQHSDPPDDYNGSAMICNAILMALIPLTASMTKRSQISSQSNDRYKSDKQ
jgi:hypothetical protein